MRTDLRDARLLTEALRGIRVFGLLLRNTGLALKPLRRVLWTKVWNLLKSIAFGSTSSRT